MIYVDHAATTRLSPQALQAMLPYLQSEYANPSGVYRSGLQASKALLDARQSLARLLDCSAREVYFTSGGSEADNQALLTMASLGATSGKKHLISCAFEHPAVLQTLSYLETQGYHVTYLLPDAQGCVSPAAVAQALRADTIGVSIMLANNEIGTLQPIEELCELCHAHEVLLHTDAVQAVGQIPVSFAALQVDFLSLSAHKFCGPKGVGALLARRGITPFSLIRGGAQERGCRAGTENVAGIVGMACALQEQCANLSQNSVAVTALREQLISGLLQIPHTHLTGHRTQRVPGIVHVCFENVESETLLLLLDTADICASAGAACSAGALKPSHVLESMQISPERMRGAMRFSLGAENTATEIDCILREVTQLVTRLRKDKQ